ncbi:Uncharacterised protein [Mycobacteroides abscessus]|nr:Uncharacterised protein [Mycobacteroides abscessus]
MSSSRCWSSSFTGPSAPERRPRSARTWSSESASTYGLRSWTARPSTRRPASGHAFSVTARTCSRVRRSSSRIACARSSRSPSARYRSAMRSSVLASDISTLSSSVAKSGHSRCASRSSSRSPKSRSAVPSPYQPARLMRACDQENTHGIARRSSRDETDRPRRAGREPIGRRPTSSSGVTCENHCGNPSARTSSWNRRRDDSSSAAARSR